MPNKTPWERARVCRVEAAWTMHQPTRALLLQLAEEYEALASRAATGHAPEADTNRNLAARLQDQKKKGGPLVEDRP